MKLPNTKESYSWAAIALHWIAAVSVITLFFLGKDIEHAKTSGAGREAIISAIYLHISVGATLFLVLAARVVLHFTSPQPEPMPQDKRLNLMATIVTKSLLAVIAIQIITGPLIVWSNGSPIRVFGLFAIPTPFAAKAEALHEALETIHATSASFLLPLIAIHLAGAVKHVIVDDQPTFRMFRVGGPTKEPAPGE